jgi:dihydrofolate reductase
MTAAVRPPLTFIAAVSRNGVIGRGGQLPWDLPEDRAHFPPLDPGATP